MNDHLHPLDDPIRSSLSGRHGHLAEWRGRVARYVPDVAPFLTLPARPEPADWADAAEFTGPGGTVPLVGSDTTPPDGWAIVARFEGVQMTGEDVEGRPEPEAVVLTEADVPEMLALVELTQPGPFLPRTIAMGTYLGIRREGRLVAMAGERLRPPGWTEISAVCTDPGLRGQGLAGRLVRAVAAGITERGDRPFLHAVATNANAISLYETLGFRLRRTMSFELAQVPGTVPA
ncbi:GNAT family N-acetyltransferase [Actinocorallia longicatena]|uniref:GNAT family N-acetyltransferase n=1 Tax=Actinocorallia longicatena TaxID=111803 RepID=A0ABP6QCX7_9ACTN